LITRDGSRIAFVRCTSLSPRTCSLWTIGVDGSGARRRIAEGPVLPLVGWSPNGLQIAFRQCTSDGTDCELRVVNADGSGNRALAKSVPQGASWSPDGKRLAVSTGGGISLVKADGSGTTGLVDTGSEPAWSPDGSRIVYQVGTSRGDGCAASANNQNSELWVMNADGSGKRQLTPTGPPCEVYPEWSPDSSRIAYIEAKSPSVYQHDAGIGIVNADGSAQKTLVPQGAYNPYVAHWAPDGSVVAFLGTTFLGAGSAGIFSVPPSGGPVSTIVSGDAGYQFGWGRVAPTLTKKPPLCKKGQKPTKTKPCRKK
jgi:Tol biopolymer transport system component